MSSLPLIAGYPPDLVAAAEELVRSGRALAAIAERYPERHRVRSNKELGAYVQEPKARHLKGTPGLRSVAFDKRLRSAHKALGLHTTKRRVHGARLRTTRELRVASVLREAPAAFLRAIVVHELAHQKHADHDRDFYRLCCHMEPEYHQLEFDLRVWLSALDVSEPSGPTDPPESPEST